MRVPSGLPLAMKYNIRPVGRGALGKVSKYIYMRRKEIINVTNAPWPRTRWKINGFSAVH